MYAGMPDDVIADLTAYGQSLGLAFQIADDLLDIEGVEAKAGKSLGTDLEQQKLTLPLIWLLENAPKEQRDRVRSILTAAGNHKREALLPELRFAGALEYARREAESHATAACTKLACLPSSPERAILALIAERAVHRDH